MGRIVGILVIFSFMAMSFSAQASIEIETHDLASCQIYHENPELEEGLSFRASLSDPEYTLFAKICENPVDVKGLIDDTKTILAAQIVGIGIIFALPSEATNWHDKYQNPIDGYTENIKAGPVMDEDAFFTNLVLHPYMGAGYYVRARERGFSRKKSFAYSVLMSTVPWEYGFEAVFERPSIQDLIITPVLGALLGEFFYVMRNKLERRDFKLLGSRKFGKTLYHMMDPFDAFGKGLFEGKEWMKGFKARPYAEVSTYDWRDMPAPGFDNLSTPVYRFGIRLTR